jgi:uncharacterized protein YutE (UPF0331/DUF86 family)
MTPGPISATVATDRAAWIRSMLLEIRSLPLESPESFAGNKRNIAAAESYLRRALEALLDLGRHILAKGFGRGVAEYKAIAGALAEVEVLGAAEAELLVKLAGYRNRMVHFYHAIGNEELRLICRDRTGDIERILDAFLAWLRANPDRVDRQI